jgi:hypothetical protein
MLRFGKFLDHLEQIAKRRATCLTLRAGLGSTAALSLVLAACGGGGSTNGGRVVPQATSTPPNASDFTFAQQSGSVQLPAGSKVSLSSLTVQNSFDSQGVANSGTFSLYADADGPQLAIVTSANGNPMMMGFLGASEPQISAHTTAEVLVYFGAGLFSFPAPLNQQAYASIAGTPGFANVEAAVSAAIAQNADAFSAANSPNNTVASALSTFLTSLYTPISASVARASSARTLKDMLVDPGNEQSGITVLNQSPVQIAFKNRYRRMAQAFVDQVSYGVSDGQSTSIQSAPITNVLPPMIIPPTTGLSSTNSTIVSTATNATAYTEITSTPLTLPVPNSLWTRYQVTIVGPGAHAGALSSLTAEQLAAQQDITLKFVIFCVFLPAVTNLILPYAASATKDDFLDPTTLSSDQAKALNDLIKTLTSTAPGIATASASGDTGSVFWQTWTAVFSSSTLKQQVVNFIVNYLVFKKGVGNLSVNQMAKVADFASQLQNATKIADAALTTFDLSQVGSAWALSNMADVYTVIAVPTQILLTPSNATVYNGLNVIPSYVVNVPAASGSNLSLTYQWQNTAAYGHFCDLSGRSDHCDSAMNPFSSTINQGFYAANATGQGTDTISVTVVAIDSSGNRIEHIQLGTASATVVVASPSPSPTPAPNDVGTPPTNLPQSRCAALAVSPHVVSIGQTITGSAGPAHPESCGGDIPPITPVTWNWAWDSSTGVTVTSGCTTTSDSCVFVARATTGAPGNRYVRLCLNGGSRQGAWTSCDYYAVTPQ